MTLRLLTTHAALLEASGEDAFVRYEVPAGLEHHDMDRLHLKLDGWRPTTGDCAENPRPP